MKLEITLSKARARRLKSHLAKIKITLSKRASNDKR